MDPDFWNERWKNQQTAFDEGHVNALLETHLAALGLPEGATIFMPLCGRAYDMAWLIDQGYRVIGAELNQSAVEDLLKALGAPVVFTPIGPLKRARHSGGEVFVGDIFDLTPDQIGPVDAVYDRAALVALPDPLRTRYAQHLVHLSNAAKQLLIAYDYEQSQTQGPPFSVPISQVSALYGAHYAVQELEARPMSGGMKKRAPIGSEYAALLHPIP